MSGFVSPLDTWFADAAALARFRRRLGRVPVILHPRDTVWRAIGPDFATTVAMARAGVPFQTVADQRYDRSGDVRGLRAALTGGATVYLPQVHQVLPRLTRLMVALRAALMGPLREESSFLFAVEGRSRQGMGMHHDGPLDAFWLQLVGRRTVTIGPRVPRGTPQDLSEGACRGRRWRTFDLEPGTLFHVPSWTPHEVVCRGRSLAFSLTWRPPSRRRARLARRLAALAAWDVVSGQVDAVPPRSRARLVTQVPAAAGPLTGRGFSLVTPDGTLHLPAALWPLARRLALMPAFRPPSRARALLAPLLEHGVLAPQELPRRILPANPRGLDGWRFSYRTAKRAR